MSATPLSAAETAENGPEKIASVAHSAVPHIDEA